MLSQQQINSLQRGGGRQQADPPRWKQTTQRYEEESSLRVKSAEDKLARRLAAFAGMRNADKKLFKWEAQNGIKPENDATLWERVLTLLRVEKLINTDGWVPSRAASVDEAVELFEEADPDSILVVYLYKSDTAVAMYALPEEIYADELPRPCALRESARGATIIILALKELFHV